MKRFLNPSGLVASLNVGFWGIILQSNEMKGIQKMYSTLKATVRQGEIKLLDEATLPENAALLVVVLDDIDLEALTLGEHLAAGLQDIRLGRVTEANTPQDLAEHLDTVFNGT